jgi:hypothetical protein
VSWALIIIVYVTVTDGGGPTTGGPAMTTVPGFETQETCHEAAAMFRSNNSSLRMTSSCILVR